MIKVLTHIGEDNWGNQSYKDEKGIIWKDLDNRENVKCKLYNSGFNIDGDPGFPMDESVEIEFIPKRIITNKEKEKLKFNYMLLGRLQSDCEYFLGYGGRSERRLWAGNVKEQIEKMKELWKSFSEKGKPEWLTMKQIEIYEVEMNKEI